MQRNEYKKLKSGTDIRGIAIKNDIATSGAFLTQEAARDIADAFVRWLKNRLNKQTLKVAVGHDSRISAPVLLDAIVGAFKSLGCEIHLCGLITTPAMFMMTKFESTRCDGVIMITASHHPYYMNGMKFFTAEGGISNKELDQILDIAVSNEQRCSQSLDSINLNNQGYSQSLDSINSNEQGCSQSLDSTKSELIINDYAGLYADLLKQQIIEFSGAGEMPLEGMKIVVDAGNGAAGFFASKVLEPLGADTSGSQFLQPDGYFPNHVPNPEDKIAIQSLKDCVVRNQADLGIIFDTDGDRVGIVTSEGSEINRNRLIAAASMLILENEQNRGAYIVTDSVTSDGLKTFIESKGGVHLRYKRGYKNVIDKAQLLRLEGKNALLAIETSGHAAFCENYFLDDGAYLAVRLIAKAVQLKRMGRNLSELIGGLKEPVESIEARLTLSGENWKADAQRIIKDLVEYSNQNFVPATDNYEGIRAAVPACSGWFLLRLSVHDPVLPLNIESDKLGGAKSIALQLKQFFSQYPMLDCSKLN